MSTPARIYVLVDESRRMLALTSSPNSRLLTRSPALAKHFRSAADAFEHLERLDELADRPSPIRFDVESLSRELFDGGRFAGVLIQDIQEQENTFDT